MLLNPKMPLIVGIAATAALAGYLFVRHPLPDALSNAHAQVMPDRDIHACERCHTAEGLTAGCLSCHKEIGSQLDTKQGYHAFLADGKTLNCTLCHPEHHGAAFPLVSSLSWPPGGPETFDHPQCDYRLTGRHGELECTDCHQGKFGGTFSLPDYPDCPRMRTFLGLTQDCLACHADVHAWPSKRACLDCHDQTAFDPASAFRHETVFLLEGVHAETDCAGCHSIPHTDGNEPAGDRRTPGCLPFHKVSGKTCEECHSNPHRTHWDAQCESCHLGRNATWREGQRGIDPQTHEPTGFPLTGRHMDVSCDKCHATDKDYAQRYPDPKTQDYQRHPQTCQGCHEDVHMGELDHACSTCHQESGWTADHLRFDHDQHTPFRLDAVHKGLSCQDCHAPEDKTYRAQGAECVSCHQVQANAFRGQALRLQAEPDPHANRLTCTDCHDMNEPRQSMDRHAQRCADCHNDQYGLLAHRWAQVLEERQTAVERRMESLDDSILEEARKDLSEARKSGFHNLNLTRQLYDRLMETLGSQDEGTPARKEDTLWTGR